MLDREKYSDLTFGESLFEYFGPETILQFYLGEKAGSTYYFDHDIEQKVFLIGRIKDAVGDIMVIETALDNGQINEIVVNCYYIQSAAPANTDVKNRTVFVKYLNETKK